MTDFSNGEFAEQQLDDATLAELLVVHRAELPTLPPDFADSEKLERICRYGGL